MTLTANFILVCTWLSLAVAVVAHDSPAARALGHHAHAGNVELSHLPVVSAIVEPSTGKIETTALQKKKRAFAGKKNDKRYYGDDRGFSKPGPLPAKRALILPTGWSSLGCVLEGQSFRALKDFSYASSTMTVESCLEVCKGQGFSLGALEWSNECYCANSWSGGGGTPTDASDCNMPCVGSADSTCGGYFTLSAYTYTAPNSTTPLTAAQCAALSNAPPSSAAPSAAASSALPSSALVAASSALPSGGASSALPSGFASSAMPFPSASAFASASASASASGFEGANFTSLAPTGTVTGSASLPTSSVISTEWEALGCYLDNPAQNNGKNILLGTKITSGKDVTPASCQTRCAGQGYNFAGLEYGNECWCGDLTTTQLSALKSNAPWCNMPCSGDASQTCGGGWSLQLFEQVDVTGDAQC